MTGIGNGVPDLKIYIFCNGIVHCSHPENVFKGAVLAENIKSLFFEFFVHILQTYGGNTAVYCGVF